MLNWIEKRRPKLYLRNLFCFQAIVKYKTSYYSFYLPIALAMRLAEIKRTDFYEKAERILLSMGLYFQVEINPYIKVSGCRT